MPLRIGNPINLLTTAKSTVVAAINEIFTKIGNLTSLTSNDKTSVVNAVNSVKADVDAIGGDLTTLKIYKASNFR